MLDTSVAPPLPVNDPVRNYAPGSPERAELKARLKSLVATPIEATSVVGGARLNSGTDLPLSSPHLRSQKLGVAKLAGPDVAHKAIQAALAAKPSWEAMSLHDRSRIFLRAADMLAGRYRATINAATMLGQSKTVIQAELDAACEFIDFLRFNVHFAARIAQEQPFSPPGLWNYSESRPLEGFVLASSPFNFTAIAGNLCTAPALMGNVVVWKPSLTQLYSAYYLMNILEEAGLPPGVINLVIGDPAEVTETCMSHPEFAGLHFTGSTDVFRSLWAKAASNVSRYRSYPRLVGETGGKDFVFAHASADPEVLAVGLVRGAFEYQGQKCSAASRAYIPASLWPQLKERLVALIKEIRMGDVADFRTFMGAVIDKRAWERLSAAQQKLKTDPSATLLAGGGGSDRDGFFIEPTLFQLSSPKHWLFETELFGPILGVYVYPDSEVEEALATCAFTSPYALTGAIFARDSHFVARARTVLRHSAGNFYINDKPTGAVVGQQPFGGGRASGTNDKAGSMLNLLRWTSPRSIKEALDSPRDVRYPSMMGDD